MCMAGLPLVNSMPISQLPGKMVTNDLHPIYGDRAGLGLRVYHITSDGGF